MEKRKGVVLLSGGLDSTTVLAMATAEGYDAFALSFWYGQRHSIELSAAKRVAERYGVKEHRILEIDLQSIGGSALTDDVAIPKGRRAEDMTDIPVTYVPARNTIFLAFALSYAEVVEANDIFLGVNALDYSGYPDCRPEFIAAFEQLASLATKAGVADNRRLRIRTPLLHLTKAEIIAKGMALGVDYGSTSSCYDPSSSGSPCGRCDACILRLKGFVEAGIEDPLVYR